MRKMRRQRVFILLLIMQMTLYMTMMCLPESVYAADRNLSDVQFTTGKYGVNCLTAQNWSDENRNTLNLTQNVILDSAAQKRANQGELRLNASVRVGANGSRTNTRRLDVMCFDKNGKQIGSTWSDGSESYKVKHHWNTLSVNDKTIPKNTYRIKYYVYNHIGTSGDLEIQNCNLIIRDVVKPSIVNITGTTNDGRPWNSAHPAGTKVTYTLYFSERVSASSIGSATISPSASVSTGSIQTKDGSSYVEYTYTIPTQNDVISDNHKIAFKGISSFTIKDDAGNSSTVGLSESQVQNLNSSISSNGSLYMDNRPPELTGITSEGFSKDTVLCAGDTIKLNLKFHENIKVPGNPSITFSNGKAASYIPVATTTDKASFTYTVGAGDDVDALTIQSLNINGIKDGVGQDTTASTRYASFTAQHQAYMNDYGVMIDTQAPTVELPVFDEEGWMNRNTVVEVTASDDTETLTGSGVKYVQYAWAEQSESAPVQFRDIMVGENGKYRVPMPESDGDWYLWMRCQDKVGNVSEPVCTAAKAKSDVAPPEISLKTEEIEGKAISVSASFSDSRSGVSKRTYQWFTDDDVLTDSGELEEDQKIPWPEESGIYLLKLSAEDNAGNVAVCEQQVMVDRVPPTVNITCETSGYAKAHTMKVSCTDNISAIDTYQYQWKQGNAPFAETDWKTAASENLVSPENENGEWRLYIRAVDSIGNQTVEYKNCLLDNIAPDILLDPDGNEGSVGIYDYSVNVITNDTVTLRNALKIVYGCSNSDDPSSVETWNDITDPDNVCVQLHLLDDTYLHVKVSDEAGNTAIKTSKAFLVDKRAPEGTITAEGNTCTNSTTINVNVTAEDDYTSAAEIKMQFSADDLPWSEWESYAEKKVITFGATEGDHAIKVRFKDAVGNVSEPVTTSITYDVTPPEIALEYSGSERTNQNVTVKANLSDGTWLTDSTYEFTGNGEYTFKAKDSAGNIGSNTAKVTWIDKTAPKFTLTSDQADAKPHKTAEFSVQSEDNDLAGYFWRVYPDGKEDLSSVEWTKMQETKQTLPELSDGNHTVEVYAEDDLANKSETSKLTIRLDNTAPKASISYSPNKRTSEDVTATLTLEDDNGVMVTSPENGSFTHIFKENGTFEFKFKDAAGNTGSAEAKVDWIDRALPKLDTEIISDSGETLSSGQWTGQPVTVALKLTHNAQKYDSLTFNGENIMGDRILNVDGIEPVPNEADTYRVTSYGVLEYQITDTEINLTSNGSLLLAVDTTKPVCEEEDIRYSVKSWTNKNVTVRVQAKDDLAKTITYLRQTKDQDGNTKYEVSANGDTFEFSQNGKHTFYFRDEAGNIGSHTVSVDWIDKDRPEAKAVFSTGDGKSYDPATWTNQDVKVRLEFSSLSPVVTPDEEIEHIFTANGTRVFTFTDAAGNQNTASVTVDKIDKMPPTGYITTDVAGWTNTDVTVTLHASDDASGTEDMTHTFTENGEYTFALKDKAGNVSEYSYTMDRIDRDAPKIDIAYSPANITKTPFSVYASAAANERVSWQNGISGKKFTENGTYSFTATDRAGNSTTATAEVDWISPDLPEVQLKYSTTERTADDVQVEICPTDENAVIRVLNNDGSRFYTFRQNGVFTFQYTDVAGRNTDMITARVDCIDKTGPVLTVQADRTELGVEPVKVTVTANEAVTWPNGVTVINENSAEIEYTENIKVRIWAKDDLGNKGYADIMIDCIDHTAPVISMDSTVGCISLGQPFDPLEGVKVEDDHLTEDFLQIEGTVDTQKAGKYTLVYTAKDAVGNTSSMDRTVYVYDPDLFQVMINGELCFDRVMIINNSQNQVSLIHPEGEVSVKALKGINALGDFKMKGTEISDALLDGSYVFPEMGYYSLFVQDQERNSKLVQVFVAD